MNRQEKIESVVDMFLNLQYGNSVAHSDIERLIGHQKTSQEYRGIVNAAKKKLLEQHHMIESVRGIGYRLTVPDNYTKQSMRQIMLGAKRIDKGTKIMSNAPLEKMSVEGLEQYHRVNDKIRDLQAATTGAKVEIRMLGAKRPHPFAQMLTERVGG